MPATDTITIDKRSFTVPNRYKEGDPLSAVEATALNQTFHDAIRNGLRKKLPDAESEAQARVDEYANAFEFGRRSPGGGPRDPVKLETMVVARKVVKAQIAKKGYNLDDYTMKQISELARKALDSHPEWVDVAKANVAAQRAAASADVDIGV